MNLYCFRIPTIFITLLCSGQTCFNAYVGVIPNVFCKYNLCLLHAFSFTVLDMFVATTETHAKQ